MSNRTFSAGPVVFGGVLLGLFADALLRAPGPFGLNLSLWAVALAGVAVILSTTRSRTLEGEAIVLLGVAVLLAGVLAWRDAPPLKLLALGGSAIAFALPAHRAGQAWVRTTHVWEYGVAVAAAVAASAFGGLFLAFDRGDDPVAGNTRRSEWWRRVAPVLRGAALALPVLLVVGGLFAAADAVFADLLSRLLRIDADRVIEHVLVAGFFAWISAGYLRSLLGRSPLAEAGRLVSWRPTIGATETVTVLALLNLLFLAFVSVQLRTLFGGSDLVQVTPGLTFAEYARRGFFELVAVAAIVIPVLLATDQLRRRESPRDDRWFRALAGIQVLLLSVVMGSAVQRLRLYLEEYGLTEARLYAAALLAWLALMLVWFTATVLRGRRERFAIGALIAGFAWIAALVVANPDATIARTNAARDGSGPGFDAAYATRLSADAVPTLIALLPELSGDARCRVARSLLRRWAPASETDWRSWSLARSRAVRMVADAGPTLEAAAREETSCPDASP